jgi:DNA-binding MarR family transcriptional regulator
MKTYTRRDIEKHFHYHLPLFLFEKEFANLSNDARVLYAVLYNNLKESISHGHIDEGGEVFLYFDRNEMQEKLGLSQRTLARVIESLEAKDLLKQERQGGGNLNKVYLCYPLS